MSRSVVEDVPEIVDERIDPDGFFGQPGSVVRVEFAPPFGFAKKDPVRSPITGTPESWLFDKGLE